MLFSSSLVSQLRSAKHVLAFTGAGVSAESGIPTFRDALTGLWSQYDPQQLATPEAFQRDQALVWGWYEYRRALVLQCQPNPAHRALALMAGQVPQFTLVTQNVDDLHERAGNQAVHLHGSLHQARCFSCGHAYQYPPGVPVVADGGRAQMPPRCTQCDGWVRPGVVWFGESLPHEAWLHAQKAARQCDVFFSIGTSAVVYPAAGLPFEAKEAGATVVQVNPQATELDDVADYSLRGPAGEVLPALLQAVWPEAGH